MSNLPSTDENDPKSTSNEEESSPPNPPAPSSDLTHMFDDLSAIGAKAMVDGLTAEEAVALYVATGDRLRAEHYTGVATTDPTFFASLRSIAGDLVATGNRLSEAIDKSTVLNPPSTSVPPKPPAPPLSPIEAKRLRIAQQIGNIATELRTVVEGANASRMVTPDTANGLLATLDAMDAWASKAASDVSSAASTPVRPAPAPTPPVPPITPPTPPVPPTTPPTQPVTPTTPPTQPVPAMTPTVTRAAARRAAASGAGNV